ncbi:MAG TPA: MFS transporter [Steroidobacteraceae bacterium]|nr:MFS transporter [Steroidobacteraceae bacterium]
MSRLPHPLRNVFMLAGAQMLGSSGLTVTVILGGIIAADIAPRPTLATVPISLAIVATALTTIPAALLMRRIGRRAGFILGASVGLIGGLVAAQAVILSSFLLFCIATVLLGGSMAFTQQYRFAAAESAPPDRLSQAISYVLIGGLGAALVNPQLALAARWLIPGTEYAGSFVAVSILYAATIAVLSRLSVPAPSVPRPKAAGEAAHAPFATPQFRMAVFAGACAYAVMSFVMTAAPISMHHIDHHDVEATTWVVQSHVLSMYLPSLFTGQVIARFGERKVMMWGGALLATCAAVSLFGHQLMHYWLGLVTLGLGWNLLFVSGTTLLSRSVEPASRHRAQALNDFTVFGSQACASLLAGLAVQSIGWRALNLVTLPLLAAMIFTASRLRQDAQVPASVRTVPSESRS